MGQMLGQIQKQFFKQAVEEWASMPQIVQQDSHYSLLLKFQQFFEIEDVKNIVNLHDQLQQQQQYVINDLLEASLST